MIDKKEFRNALGAFVTGVTIVTTRDAEGRPVGLTANSFNSVSLDPPLVLFSLALDSANLPAFRQAESWAVHILSVDQQDLSNRFASRGADKFSGLDFADGPEGAPLLPGCTARFGCKATFEYEGGDHAIFVGEVIDFTKSDSLPLAYHGGRYSHVREPAAPAVPDDLESHYEFGRYFIGHLLGSAYAKVFSDLRREYRARGLRASEYTVISAVGLGEGCTRDELAERAAKGGLALPDQPIDGLIQRGEIALNGNKLYLTDSGKKLLTELIAVAQATQLRIEETLSAEDMNLLHSLLKRIADSDLG